MKKTPIKAKVKALTPIKRSRFQFKVAFATVAFCFTLLGGLWQLDKHWTPREIYEIAIAQQMKTNEQFQKQIEATGLQQQVFYFQRRCEEIKKQARAKPRDINLAADYAECLSDKKQVEDKLYNVQKPK